jgi:hydantoinase/carbamoylase family amidase
MEEAGMAVHVDAVGNIIGRLEGETPGLPAVILGSHLDTVPDAGKYDGVLGVVTAISCVAELNHRRRALPFAIEVMGFGEEQGVRFQSTLIGNRAVAGALDDDILNRRDGNSVSLRKALGKFGLDGDRIHEAARRPEEFLAYIELHIEQGPILEQRGLPLGVVSAIVGDTRLSVEIEGTAGHAGTVPMALRRDALAAAAECIVTVERICREQELVGTVDRLDLSPGAINVIPGRAVFIVDIRSESDTRRQNAVRIKSINALLREVTGGTPDHDLIEGNVYMSMRRLFPLCYVTTGDANLKAECLTERKWVKRLSSVPRPENRFGGGIVDPGATRQPLFGLHRDQYHPGQRQAHTQFLQGQGRGLQHSIQKRQVDSS